MINNIYKYMKPLYLITNVQFNAWIIKKLNTNQSLI